MKLSNDILGFVLLLGFITESFFVIFPLVALLALIQREDE